MRQDLVDHGWSFDARDHLDRTTTVFTGLDLDLEHALQPLGPRHRDVPGWRRISSRLGRAPAALGRRHLFTQPVIRREHAVIARQVDSRRRHQGGQSRHKVERLKHHVCRAIPVRRLQAVANIPLGGLVHGAYRTGNLLIHEDRISAVLDWELQVLGDPMYDVAYVLSDLNREGTDLLSNLVDRDAFYRDYEAATGFTIDDEICRYYNALYAMRSVAFWMSASGLYADGRSNDIRLARTRWSVPVVLDRAARELGY